MQNSKTELKITAILAPIISLISSDLSKNEVTFTIQTWNSGQFIYGIIDKS